MGVTKLVSLLIFLALLTGCIQIKSYVPPTPSSINLSTVKGNHAGPTIGVLVEFQREGKEYAEVRGQARETVFRVLKQTRIFKNVLSGTFNADVILKIVIDNTDEELPGDIPVTNAQAPLGPNDIGVTDRYVISLDYKSAVDPGVKVRKAYRHSIISTIRGNKAPYGLKPIAVDKAFDRVIDDVILLFLSDIEKMGLISFTP